MKNVLEKGADTRYEDDVVVKGLHHRLSRPHPAHYLQSQGPRQNDQQ